MISWLKTRMAPHRIGAVTYRLEVKDSEDNVLISQDLNNQWCEWEGRSLVWRKTSIRIMRSGIAAFACLYADRRELTWGLVTTLPWDRNNDFKFFLHLEDGEGLNCHEGYWLNLHELRITYR